jgi:predicted dienelactone hydrolase
MRPFEAILLLLNLASLLARYLPVYPALRWTRFLPAAGVVLAAAQLIVEHYRWQMVPAYGMTAALFLMTLPGLVKGAPHRPGRGAWAFFAGGFGVLWWLGAVTLPVILPVPVLPTPPGPYAIGSVIYDWTDASRAETYSSDPNAKREIMVQIWYPAQPAPGDTTVPLVDNWDTALPAFAKFLGVPAFTLDHLRLATTHTYGGAPIRADGAPYPVVIYSHGYTGYRNESFSQMEALASSGFVVVSIDHPYASAFTVFSDGRVVVNNPDMLPPTGRNQAGDQAMRTNLQAVVVADEQFVMDQLAQLNAGALDTRFTGKFDLTRIGLTGVSLGGGAITWTCQIDARCKAGLAQDGWYEPMPADIAAQPLRQPFMFLQSDTKMWKMGNLDRLQALYQAVSAPAYHLKIAGLLHDDFGDLPLLTPVSALLSNRGPMNGARAVNLVDVYIVAFFDQYLKNQPSPLLNGPSAAYPEVTFQSHTP